VRLKLDKASLKVYEAELEGRKVLLALQKSMREIIIHRQQALSLRHFEAVLDKTMKPRQFIAFSAWIPGQVLEFTGFATIGILVVLMIAARTPMEQIVTTASLLMLTAWRILPAVNRCLSASVQIRGMRKHALAYLDLYDFLKKGDREGPPVEPDPDFSFKASLSLDHVFFRYPGAAHDALSDFSLTVGKGESLGVIGPSGSGKSTLALILTALVHPDSGAFLIDGKPVTPEAREAYFKILGYVPQSPLILDGTLAENIAFRGLGEGSDVEKLKEAARMAGLDLEKEMPGGLDARLSSASQTLSGGQNQRIAVARALYTDPQVLIFDEATSALDIKTENIVRNTVRSIKGRATSVMIAHRLTTVEYCDRIIWLDGGRLFKSGPPGEMLPLYRRIVKEQEERRMEEEAGERIRLEAEGGDGEKAGAKGREAAPGPQAEG
jgi:ABC-type multidrug transport system fused ATPase/permease subunit